jgi:hypothetical protein
MMDKQKKVNPGKKSLTTLSSKDLKKKTSFFYLEDLLIDCPDFKSFKKEDVLDQEELAKNTHFKKNGEVYRLRIFIDDATNGSYKKLVFYKEDQEGFPEIVNTSGNKAITPSNEYIQSFLEGGEVIYESQDMRLELKDQRVLTVTEENGEIVKLNSEQDNCLFEK